MLISQYTNIDFIKLFKSLADETRLRILRILSRGSFHVNEILFIVNGKQSNISHHLKIMQEAGVIKSKKEGSWIFYRINEENGTGSVKSIIDTVMLDEKKIPCYDGDIKRLDAVLQKRKNEAEIFFNSIGDNFDNIQDNLFRDIYSVKDSVELFSDDLKTILDVGCGTGRNLPLLAGKSQKVIGIDASPSMLQLSEHYCKKNKLNYELRLGDIDRIPFGAESIDGVFINMVLHHISDPASALKEISRVLVNNGELLLIELLSHDNDFMREKYADLWLGFSIEDLNKWLKQSGFIVKESIMKESDINLGNNYFRITIILAEKKLDVIEVEI